MNDWQSSIRALAAQIESFSQSLGVASPSELLEADRLLDLACEKLSDDELDQFAICLGFWLGESLIARHSASWVGLEEPVPPRVALRNHLVSPIDAVRRRIEQESAPSIEQLVCTLLDDTSSQPQTREQLLDQNRDAWNQRTNDSRFASPTAPRLSRAQAKSFLDPQLRSEELESKNLLLLGGAGGTHAILHAQAGANVTVVDLSPELLAIDQQQANELGLALTLIEASADDLSMLDSTSFHFVVQPVLTSYLPSVDRLYREVHRVLVPGGLYLTQHKHPAALMSRWNANLNGYELLDQTRFAAGQSTEPNQSPLRERGTREFAHSLHELLGALCRTGFLIENFEEPLRANEWAQPNTIEHLACHTSVYFKVAARKPKGV